LVIPTLAQQLFGATYGKARQAKSDIILSTLLAIGVGYFTLGVPATLNNGVSYPLEDMYCYHLRLMK
jgi:hypothetical protein